MAKRLRYPVASNLALTLNNTLTSGITKVDTDAAISELAGAYGEFPGVYCDIITVNALKKNISADAAEGFGEHIATFPAGFVQPLGADIYLLGSAPSGLSATAGEIGLGTTIATGAIATLGAGSAAMENLMEGTTIANHVAATPLAIYKANDALIAGTHSATVGSGSILDARAGTTKIHLNIASTWNQTSAEDYTFSGAVRLFWRYLGPGA